MAKRQKDSESTGHFEKNPRPGRRTVRSARRGRTAVGARALVVADERFVCDGSLTTQPGNFVAECLSSGETGQREAVLENRHFRFVVVPIPDRGYVDVYGFDITEMKTLERQLLQASKMEAVGRIAGGVAHDFNNMIQVINGFADYLATKLEENDSAHAITMKIKEAGERAAALTAQLLAFSRKRNPRLEVVNLSESIAALESLLERALSRRISYSATFQQGLWPVRVDPTQLDQVILNLAINARDAMPGGGTVTIDTSNVTIAEDYRSQQFDIVPGDYVRLAVSDTGVGMDEDTCSKIFEPFFTTKEEGIGTGLGLAVVYGAVRDAKGDIRVSSTPGRGTTFEILLPRGDGVREPE